MKTSTLAFSAATLLNLLTGRGPADHGRAGFPQCDDND